MYIHNMVKCRGTTFPGIQVGSSAGGCYLGSDHRIQMAGRSSWLGGLCPSPSVGVLHAMASSSGLLRRVLKTMAWSVARYFNVFPDCRC